MQDMPEIVRQIARQPVAILCAPCVVDVAQESPLFLSLPSPPFSYWFGFLPWGQREGTKEGYGRSLAFSVTSPGGDIDWG